MNWYERKAMEKVNTFLSNDGAFPKVDMPEPCYLPERGRRNFPIRRE
jgi:hypothetical protein